MPIPQLSKKLRSSQSWRNQRSYAPKKSGGSRYGGYYYRGSGGGLKKLLFSKKFLKFASVLLIAGIIFLGISFLWLSRGLPNPNQLIEREVAQSTKIYDRTGENILYEIHGEEKRTLVPLSEIPDNLKWATIAIEDKDFYKHGGFSLWAIFRTVATNVLFGRKGGGSTLTQQFVKNAILTNEKTYTRKIKELMLAYRLEKKFSKDEILTMYFNEIPYGSTAYGAEAASRRYFGKKAKDISLAEAAILAALPQAPSRYSPYGTHKDLLIERQHYILDLMVEQKYASKETAEQAKKEDVKFKDPAENITAPHFVMYIKEVLSEKYGEKMIEQGGLKIYTTLDLYKQKIAEEMINKWAVENEKKYGAKNAALVSTDPKTGQVLAMVGSRDYFNDEIDGQVNVATSLRQPGSSIKPIVYAASFIKGFTPNTVLYDVVTNFSTDPAKPYEPHNYSNNENGPVTIRQALAGSLNIPAVKAIYLAGVDNVLKLANEMGYTSLTDKNRFGLSLVLGGGEVKLIEHTNAFGAFAREGIVHPLSYILKIEDKDGKIIDEYKEEKKKAFDAEIAKEINDILSDNAARAFVFGEKNYLTLGSRPVAAKTGTTNDYRDAWTVGYTPSLVTGVWVGNSDNTEMSRGADGSKIAAPIWHDYMEKVLGDTPIEYFKKPEAPKTGKPVLDGNTAGEVRVKIDRASGLLATDLTPESFIEEKVYKEAHCILYYVNKDDPRGEAPKNPSDDPQFNLWESRVLAWAEKQGFATSTPNPPTGYDSVHIPENQPVFTIESPSDKQIVMGPNLKVNISATAPRGISRAEYYINDGLFALVNAHPFNLEKNIGFLSSGFHKLTVRVCDDIDNCANKNIEFNLVADNNTKGGDIGVSWYYPSGGQTIENPTFPINLKVGITNPAQTARVVFSYKSEAKNEVKTIKTIFTMDSNEAQTAWQTELPEGGYKLYAESFGWNGQTAKSEEITITIKKPEIKP